METINFTQAQADIDALQLQDKAMRRLRKDPWSDLRPHTAEILAWARARGGSKYKIQRLLARSPQMQHVSADRIYRFVLSVNGGRWPNSRQARKGGN